MLAVSGLQQESKLMLGVPIFAGFGPNGPNNDAVLGKNVTVR
jgi:hypothetical protein